MHSNQVGLLVHIGAPFKFNGTTPSKRIHKNVRLHQNKMSRPRTSKRSTAGRRKSATIDIGVSNSSHESNAKTSKHFPLRLHDMLTDAKDMAFEDIVSWQPHGRCFVVHRPKEFVEEVMPQYFSQSKFPSFQRQLNIYGFSRITQGKDKNGYHHRLFLRGFPNLSDGMVRQKIKGTKVRHPPRPEMEPNFYSYPPLSDDVNSSSIGASMHDASRSKKKKRRSTKTLASATSILKTTSTRKIVIPSSRPFICRPNDGPFAQSTSILVTPPDTPLSDRPSLDFAGMVPSTSDLVLPDTASPPNTADSGRETLISVLEGALNKVSPPFVDDGKAPATMKVNREAIVQEWPSLVWPTEEQQEQEHTMDSKETTRTADVLATT